MLATSRVEICLNRNVFYHTRKKYVIPKFHTETNVFEGKVLSSSLLPLLRSGIITTFLMLHVICIVSLTLAVVTIPMHILE